MAESKMRQMAMVLDLNKCLGCQTCTIACKQLWTREQGTEYAYWNNVETMPGAGYPRRWQEIGGRDDRGQVKRGDLPTLDDHYGRAWRFNHEQAFHGEPGQRPWLRPDAAAPGATAEQAPQWGPNWDEDHGAGTYPRDNHYFYLPRLCNHCTHPACRDACPRAAIEKRAADGIVVVNQDRCHGYRFCAEACPYKKIFFDPERAVATKCIFCFPRVEAGVAPACARQCPGRLRFVGYRDDPAGPIHQLVDVWKVALPLHPEFGTEPNVFYVPPLSPAALDADGAPAAQPRIPTAFLVSLFGPGVHDALATLTRERERRRTNAGSALMDLLIAYDWHDNFKLVMPRAAVQP